MGHVPAGAIREECPGRHLQGRERHGVSIPVATALLVTAQGIGAVAGALALPSLAERFGPAGGPPVRSSSCRCSWWPTGWPRPCGGRSWPSWLWAPAISPSCPGSTRSSSSGPRPKSGAVSSGSTWWAWGSSIRSAPCCRVDRRSHRGAGGHRLGRPDPPRGDGRRRRVRPGLFTALGDPNSSAGPGSCLPAKELP